MDDDRFDRIARDFFSSDTRRGVLRLLASLPLGLMLGAFRSNGSDANAEDDDRGSSHRHHRRVARHRHHPGDDHEHRNDRKNRNGRRNGTGKPNTLEPEPTGVVHPECEGKADRTCCGGARSGQWCQNGACETIADDAVATLRECGGRCDCVVSPECGGILIGAEQEVCGKVLTCISCFECLNAPNNCSGSGTSHGPDGFANYCFYDTGTGGDCGSPDYNLECPDPAHQTCLTTCRDICYGS